MDKLEISEVCEYFCPIAPGSSHQFSTFCVALITSITINCYIWYLVGYEYIYIDPLGFVAYR